MYGQDGMTYKNSSYSALERAKDLLQRMTWEEKIGLMGGIRVLLGANLTFNETTYNSIHELQNGILGNFSDSLMLPYIQQEIMLNHIYLSGFRYNLNNALDVLPIANKIRAQETSESLLEIPYITVTDSVNSIYLPGGTLFPSTLSMSAWWNIPLYEQVISAIRDENVATGVRWVLSPELDVARELRNGRVGEMNLTFELGGEKKGKVVLINFHTGMGRTNI
ncbi:hypothetical protein EIK77_007901 [Talaromyces pinophilus]|nr:hypothetical protein EIK77_007901 [Talaromyces pinophilus]